MATWEGTEWGQMLITPSISTQVISFLFCFLLWYSCHTILSKFQMYYIVIHNFQRLYSIYSYYKTLAIFPVPYNIPLYWQLIYFIHSSLYLLIPYLYLASTPSLSPLVTTSLFSISVSLYLLGYSLVCFIFSTQVISAA